MALIDVPEAFSSSFSMQKTKVHRQERADTITELADLVEAWAKFGWKPTGPVFMDCGKYARSLYRYEAVPSVLADSKMLGWL